MNDNSSGSDMDGEMDEDVDGTYDFAPLPPFDFQRESEKIRRTGALHLLRMKDKDRVSQAGIDSFVENTTSIVRTSVQILKLGLMNKLDTAGIDFRAVPGLPELFQEDSLALNPFSGLRKENEQNKYFKDHFNLVEPRKIVMGQYHKKVHRGNKLKDIRKTDDAYYIPLLESLEQLLNDDSILEEIDNPHIRNDGLLSDYCDGDIFRRHPLFSSDPKALQLILYFDEFEVCNPLGSRANRHKIGFYYTLGNIRPENRSHKNAIQLLGLVTTKHLKKYGVEPLLNAFMQDLAQLEQDAGYQSQINGEPRSLQGTIAFFCGDNLGSQFIGGFKEGSQAHRPCRECMGDKNQIQTHFHEREFVLRIRDSHDRQCIRLVNNPHYSKMYGIKSRSVLNKSRYYHVVGGLPPDAMHDILEGVLHYSVKETLKVMIFEKEFVTIDELNKRISSFDYGYQNDSTSQQQSSEVAF